MTLQVLFYLVHSSLQFHTGQADHQEPAMDKKGWNEHKEKLLYFCLVFQ